MIKAFLASIPSMYEGEDIEIRYCLFEDGKPLKKESRYLEYVKPVIVGQTAFWTLLNELEVYKDSEICIIFNDGALYEILRGTSTLKNGEVIKMSNKINRQLSKFEKLSYENVGSNKEALNHWKTVLES